MRVLYAFPGTGFGHISRAREFVPILNEYCDLDVLISGPNRHLAQPFEVRYRMEGLTFFSGEKGGINFWKTFKDNSIVRLSKEIKGLDLNAYDLIISDFEPISAFAAKCQQHPNSIELSHQSAVMHPSAPKPEKGGFIGKYIIRHLCPLESKLGFHFWSYDKDIYTPVIRKEIRNLTPENRGHYCVYLPAYSPAYLQKILSAIPEVKWHIFSQKVERYKQMGNCNFYPADNLVFQESFASCEGILCGAGFETPAEALFMGKKLLVIPMKNQFEQQCNAEALRQLGVDILPHLTAKELLFLRKWLTIKTSIRIDYPDRSNQIICSLVQQKEILKSSEEIFIPSHINLGI
jgi:uncharacterized protein (TIGR00661 family)